MATDTFGVTNVVEDTFVEVGSDELLPQPENSVNEMAGLQTLLTNDNKETLLEDFNDNFTEFQSGDTSRFGQTLGSIQAEINAGEDFAIQTEIIENESLTPEDKVDEIVEVKATTPQVDPYREAVFKGMNEYAESATTEAEFIKRTQMATDAYEAFSLREDNRKLAQQLIKAVPLDAKKIVGGLGLQIIPFTAFPEHHIPIIRTAWEATGKKDFLTGEAIATTRKYFNQLDETDKREFMLHS